jgi:hypothetical protein
MVGDGGPFPDQAGIGGFNLPGDFFLFVRPEEVELLGHFLVHPEDRGMHRGIVSEKPPIMVSGAGEKGNFQAGVGSLPVFLPTGP